MRAEGDGRELSGIIGLEVERYFKSTFSDHVSSIS